MVSSCNLPWSPGRPISFMPCPKNSGAPHSSVMMCELAWQRTPPQGGVTWASASEFAAVPVGTRKTATSRLKYAESRFSTSRVIGSLPYPRTKPSLTAAMALRMPGAMAAVLSLAKFMALPDNEGGFVEPPEAQDKLWDKRWRTDIKLRPGDDS